MKRLFAAALFFAGTVAAATCPFGIPVVTVPPQQVAGFAWGPAIQPMGDACVGSIAVDPANDLKWYVGGMNGLYVTSDGGQTWTHPLVGEVQVNGLVLVPGNPTLVYVGIGTQLYLTRDQGAHWTNIGNYPMPIYSIHVAGYNLFVGLGWSAMMQSGVYTSTLGGGFPAFHSFGPGQLGLIVWTITHDPLTGNIYAGTEIGTHPKPYHPPFFKSINGGSTWTNVGAALPWHVIGAAVHPANGYIYAMTEGLGVYGSATAGATWLPPVNSLGLGGSLLSDPNQPSRLYAGRQIYSIYDGGAFLSVNGGQTFQPIGLAGVRVFGLAVNGNSKKLYAAGYASGIYVAKVP